MSYPIIKTEEEVSDMIKENLSETRKKIMLNKVDEIKKQLDHYKKIKNRWTRWDSGLKITGLCTAFATTVVVSVLSAGAFAAPVVVGTLAGLAAFETALTEIFTISFTARKKKIYREKCEVITEYLNKMYVYIEMAKEDKVITIDELTGLNKLIDEMNVTLLRSNLRNNKNNIKNDLGESLIGTYSTLKKNEVKEITKEIEKEHLKTNLTSMYANVTPTAPRYSMLSLANQN